MLRAGLNFIFHLYCNSIMSDDKLDTNLDMTLPENNGGYIWNETTQEWEDVGDPNAPGDAAPDPMDVEFRIYCNGFWSSFSDVTSSGEMTQHFFADLFSRTSLKNFVFVDNIEIANVLFESVFAPTMVHYRHDWKYKIHFSGESIPRTDLYFPNKSYYQDYDVVLCSHGAVQSNVIDLPFFVYYIYNGGRYERLLPALRFYKHAHFLPEKFCCYVVSNGNMPFRDRILDVVSGYKHVDSAGRHRNNMGLELPYPYTSEELISFISKYKFMICFENTIEGTYVTEKLVNAFLARVIPIYYGTNYVTQVFNSRAFLMLEDQSEASFDKLLAQIKELDENDAKYIEMLNEPVFADGFDYETTYGVDTLAQNVESIIAPLPDTYTGVNDDKYPEDVQPVYICLIAYRSRYPQEFRREELRGMIENMQAFFTSNKKDLKLVIVEQDNDKPFNKGVLWNAAFLEAHNYYEALEPKVYMHNNSDNRINLGEPFPGDLARPEVGFMDIRRVPHLDDHIGSQMLGGCCAFDGGSMRATNGFPNDLWGWGGDDWAIMRRIRECGVAYRKSSVFNTKFMYENRDHVRDKNTNDMNISKAMQDPITNSGLNNCKYDIMRFGEFYDEEDGIIHLCIDF